MKTLLKLFVVWVICAILGIPLGGCAASPSGKDGNPLIVHAHFIGSEQLLASPDAAKLKEVWKLKSSDNFRNEVLNRFSILPSVWLGLAKTVPAQTNLIRPLLDDLLSRECYVNASSGPDFVLAVRVSAEHARIWETNLWSAATGWKLGKPSAVAVDGFNGWEVKNSGTPSVLRCLRAGEWVVVSAGNGKSAHEAQTLASVKSAGRPAKASGAWLDGDVNLARLSGWLPVLSNFENAPVAHFSMSNRADFVRTHAVLDFPKPHGWKPEPWKVPTEAIFDPLVNFVAARGIAPFLESFKDIRDLGYKPTPNQIIGWGNRFLPFQFTYVAPSSGVSNKLKALAPKLDSLLLGKHDSPFSSDILMNTNGQQIIWRGLPVAVPQLGATFDGKQEYLALSSFPALRTTNKPPAELYQFLTGPNDLVAYDFEYTEIRMQHWRQFYQLMEIGTGRALASTNLPVEAWLTEVAPKLGESVTELHSTSPSQMSFVRKSPLGLTAFELVTLCRWIESTNFPVFGVFPPQPTHRPPKAGAKNGK